MHRADGGAVPVAVQVDRMLLADSGVLLICYSDPSGQLQRLRERHYTAFPGMPCLCCQLLPISRLHSWPAQHTACHPPTLACGRRSVQEAAGHCAHLAAAHTQPNAVQHTAESSHSRPLCTGHCQAQGPPLQVQAAVVAD